MRHLPNALTITRILLTPVLLVLLPSTGMGGRFWALVLLVLAAISDYLDGKIARSFQVRSRLGQFLDPFADKILVLGTFIMLVYLMPGVIPWWAVLLIALRDLAVTLLRSWHEAQGRSIRTLGIAKTKTIVQLIFLIAILALRFIELLPGWPGRSAAWVLQSEIPFIVLMGVVAFTLLTGGVYLMRQDVASPAKLNG
jgi:CDP-diacylglycerol--glycerol-3-phosphate 3-phosphatidyltransferase